MARTRWIVQPKDALRARLTARSQATSRTPRQRSCSTCERELVRRHLPAVGDRSRTVGALFESEVSAGGLREEAARALGLPAGIAVAVGGADAPAAALGLGLAREADAPGIVLISLGRAGRFWRRSRGRRWIRPVGCTACATSSGSVVHHGRYPFGCASLDWVVRLLRPDDPNGARELLAAAARVPAGSDGLTFLPTARRADAALRSGRPRALVGLQIGHGRRSDPGGSGGSAFALAEGLT